MKLIELKNIKKAIIGYAMVDDEDYEWLSEWSWYTSHDGYVIRCPKHKTVYMHVEIAKKHEFWKKGFDTDHINLDKPDNRKCNLRMATKFQNRWNRKPQKNSRHHPGVFFHKNRKNKPWEVEIMYNNKMYYLGYYKTLEEAIKIAEDFRRKNHGEFYTNQRIHSKV